MPNQGSLIKGFGQHTNHLSAVLFLLPLVPPLQGHGMAPLAASLATLFFFSGFVTAQINAPDCSSSALEWVCFLNSFFFFFFSPLPPVDELTGCSQTFNTLDQNACTVAAYLMSTCNGGCEYCVQFLLTRLLKSILQRILSYPCCRDTHTPVLPLVAPTCAAVTLSHIHS